MKMLILALATGGLSLTGYAAAHPTDIPYDTRGECEAAYAEASKFDRERLVADGVFPTPGAAQKTFNEIFACEYDEYEDAWYIVFTPPM